MFERGGEEVGFLRLPTAYEHDRARNIQKLDVFALQ